MGSHLLQAHEAADLTRVLVAVTAFQRPVGLRRVLLSLARQRLSSGVGIEVCVVDNDPDLSANPVVTELASAYPWPLHYEIEPRVGISHARNRVMEGRASGFDHLAFIDDDEEAEADWLAQLLAVQKRFNADVVAGPVQRVFPDGAPQWARHAEIFRTHSHPDGARLRRVATGNVLLCVSAWKATALRFDPRLALSGGEDELFFREWAALGADMRWAACASVREYLEPQRLRWRWVWRRAIGRGNASTRIQFFRRSAPRALLMVFALVLLQAPLAIQRLVRDGRSLRHVVGVHLLQAVGMQLGLLSGLMGLTLSNYRQPVVVKG